MIHGMLRKSYFYSGGNLDVRIIASLDALCPACGFEHSFSVDLEGHGLHVGDTWSFEGDYENPTFSPSMLSNRDKDDKHKPICHSFLKNGVWEYLKDCTHEMAGKHISMIPIDPDMSFERRHGSHLYPWTDDEGKPKKEI